MQKLISLKSLKKLSWVLLLVMLTVAINGLHKGAHAMQCRVIVANDQLSYSEISATNQCPCCPVEQHNHSDGCYNCVHCACHVPLVVQPFQLGYSPLILNLSKSSLFRFLPEVYLPKFIPPQIHV